MFTAETGEGWNFSCWECADLTDDATELSKQVAYFTIPASAAPITIRAVFVSQP